MRSAKEDDTSRSREDAGEMRLCVPNPVRVIESLSWPLYEISEKKVVDDERL
jgi:hypothetical protein